MWKAVINHTYAKTRTKKHVQLKSPANGSTRPNSKNMYTSIIYLFIYFKILSKDNTATAQQYKEICTVRSRYLQCGEGISAPIAFPWGRRGEVCTEQVNTTDALEER